MRKIFAGKSTNKTFLGMFALMSATSALLHSCNFKNEVNNDPVVNSQEHPSAEIVPKMDDESVDPDKRVIYLREPKIF